MKKLVGQVTPEERNESSKFQNWWDRMGQKYKWESIENGRWEINFDTCEIFLVN